MFLAEIQERAAMVGQKERTGTAAISWVLILQIQLHRTAPGRRDPWRTSGRRKWTLGDSR